MAKLLLLTVASLGIAAVANAHELLQARNPQITARAIFEPDAYGMGVLKRQLQCPSANYTPCPDGSGCCPGGAACFKSNGVGLCSVVCSANQPQCVFNGVSACCGVGESCGGSVCVPGSAAAPTSTPSPSATVTPSSTTTPTSAPSAASAPSSVSRPTVTSSSTLDTAGLTTFALPTTRMPLPTTSSSSSTCPAPSVYCSWPATTVSGNSTYVTLQAMSGCCAGGCNPTQPGLCLPATVTSTSVVIAGGSTTSKTAAIATVASAGATKILLERSWVIGLVGLFFGL